MKGAYRIQMPGDQAWEIPIAENPSVASAHQIYSLTELGRSAVDTVVDVVVEQLGMLRQVSPSPPQE